MKQTALGEMRQITDKLLSSDNPATLEQAALKLHRIFSSITGIDDGSADTRDSNAALLPNGAAIAPRDAARCVIDSARTSKFLRGIHAAITDVGERFPAGPIEILYAGCGPFATLVLPLTTRFRPDQIQLTLIDTHARALELVRGLFQALGLNDYVRDYIQTDATTYVHRGAAHLLVIEAMQTALSKEPQVGITLNLAPQLCKNGLLIPEKVTVDLCSYDPRLEYLPPDTCLNEPVSSSTAHRANKNRMKLGRVFELTAAMAFELGATPGELSKLSCLPAAGFEIPAHLGARYELLLSTTITVYRSHVLGEYESGLTHPLPLFDFSRANRGDRLDFLYSLASKPGLEHRWIARGRVIPHDQ